MTDRYAPLQLFVDAADAAFAHSVTDPRSRRSTTGIFSALKSVGTKRPGPGSRLPVCSVLSTALAVEMPHQTISDLVLRFKDIEPLLVWVRRSTFDGTASANFVDGHANAMILGPGGLEERGDVRIGVSLLAPHVRYPDHSHPPEETYLSLSDGCFRQEGGAWFAPGVGGSFYNRPSIRHAMRSSKKPLFAFWVLLGSAN